MLHLQRTFDALSKQNAKNYVSMQISSHEIFSELRTAKYNLKIRTR